MRLLTTLLLSIAATQTTYADALTDYQWIGSHNSYKQGLPASVYQFLAKNDPHAAKQINYGHGALEAQLDSGLRQLEIDVVNDLTGSQYDKPELATRLGETWLSEEAQRELALPGFKVLHIPHVDVQSHCTGFAACLNKLKRWSEAHADHFPVVVLMNAKENQPSFINSPAPVPFTAATYDQLNEVIRTALKERVITPDEIRGDFSTLREAVLERGWPDADSLRGKFIFVFDGNVEQNARFMENHAGLKGRVMFASLPANDDGAAFMIINDPFTQHTEINQRVAEGFLVRTRADADFSASNEEKAAQKMAAFTSGAQMISTDFYPGSPQAKRDGHVVSFANGALHRKNPVTQ